MARDTFENDCPDCRPVIIDPETGKIYGPDSDIMRAVTLVWEEAPINVREAFHRVTCLNSRSPFDLHTMQAFSRKISEAMDKLEKQNAN
jgi:hypothetical protein